MTLQIADSDPANIECLLQARGIKLDAVAQASPRAWAEYDTTVVHQVQAYGSGPGRAESEIPQNVSIAGANAAWIPAQDQLVATNGTQSSGGSYVTVSISGASSGGGGAVPVARAVAAAILSVAPRGASPGPAPS